MAPINASKTSEIIESLSLPPVLSSPFPSNKYSERLISVLAIYARVGSHTNEALHLVISPSGIDKYVEKI